MSAPVNQFSRSEMLLGKENQKKLFGSKVIVFGLGGVGSFAVEALARAGIGTIALVDGDSYSVTNLNRQLFALHSTVGMKKVEAAAERIHDINPFCKTECHDVFFTPENAASIDLSSYNYIIDCIDTVSAKIFLAEYAEKHNVPIISSMGTGNKLDPLQFAVADIYKTDVCPLARVMRKELKKRGIKKLKCVYSKELPVKIKETGADFELKGKAAAPGSVSFVPPAAGLIIAGEVVKDLIFGQ